LSLVKSEGFCGASIKKGEVCLFPNHDYLHESIGSLMERRLIQYNKEQCRWCGKKKDYEKFCSYKCQQEYNSLFELRLKVGKHDLRRRGFD